MNRKQHADRGSGLILAIGFMLMVGTIAAGLTSLVISSIHNHTTLEQIRDNQYAADGAIETAIATMATPTSVIAPGYSAETVAALNNVKIRVDWVIDSSPLVATSAGEPYNQLNVIFSACVNVVDAACGVIYPPATVAAAPVIIRAQVNFETGTKKPHIQQWSVLR